MSPSPISVRHWTATYALGRARPRLRAIEVALDAIESNDDPQEVSRSLQVALAAVEALGATLDHLIGLAKVEVDDIVGVEFTSTPTEKAPKARDLTYWLPDTGPGTPPRWRRRVATRRLRALDEAGELPRDRDHLRRLIETHWDDSHQRSTPARAVAEWMVVVTELWNMAEASRQLGVRQTTSSSWSRSIRDATGPAKAPELAPVRHLLLAITHHSSRPPRGGQ